MQNPQTVKEAFTPLHKRLTHFETENYLLDPKEDLDEDFEGRINHVLHYVHLFENSEVSNEANVYEKRVHEILRNLKPKEKEGVLNEYGFEINRTEISEDRKAYIMQEWKTEMFAYLYYLDIIKKNSSHSLEKEKSVVPSVQNIIFQLPENFTVLDIIKQNFKPVMKPKETALFFHYMQELKIMPKYDDKSTSKLASPFFAVGPQSTREGFMEINKLKKDKTIATSLMEKLELIIKEIDKGLEAVK